jgi:5-formyltetrahydrofolate cyclo-ligase
LSSGKTLVYPRVEHGGLVFVPMTDPDLLRPGSFDVPEPCHGQVIAPEEIDLFVVPGVAFDLVGHRLGYGRGFYDRALGQCPAKTVKVGFSYDFQVVDALPVRPHDQRLTVLITETRLLVFSR